jgi:hypothetical protein
MNPMGIQPFLLQSGRALAGFALGGAAMFWLPWVLALVFRRTGDLGFSGFLRILGMHVIAALFLAGAYALLFAVHLLIRPRTSDSFPERPMRLHVFTGLLGAGLFYLLLPVPFLQSHPVAMVLVVLGAILAIHYLWELRSRSAAKPDWLQ